MTVFPYIESSKGIDVCKKYHETFKIFHGYHLEFIWKIVVKWVIYGYMS